jgi:hypothetical protein
MLTRTRVLKAGEWNPDYKEWVAMGNATRRVASLQSPSDRVLAALRTNEVEDDRR